jgi:hypothetical protein
MSDRSFKFLVDPLLQYARDNFQETTLEKLFVLELICEIIRINIANLYNTRSLKQKQEAIDYFNSARFEYHCDCLCIPKETMCYIVRNPHKYITKPRRNAA